MSECKELGSPLRALAELFGLGVAAVECFLELVDLGFESGPWGAVPPADVLELTVRCRELCGVVLVLPLELLLLLGDLVEDRVAMAAVLVEGEGLGG